MSEIKSGLLDYEGPEVPPSSKKMSTVDVFQHNHLALAAAMAEIVEQLKRVPEFNSEDLHHRLGLLIDAMDRRDSSGSSGRLVAFVRQGAGPGDEYYGAGKR